MWMDEEEDTLNYNQIRANLDRKYERDRKIKEKMANCDHDWEWDITLSVCKKCGKFG